MKKRLDALLGNRGVIWLLLAVNFLGTIYGYIWYGNQLEYTVASGMGALLPFVPDSPTASLFFTVSLVFLLYPPKRAGGGMVRALIEALAVVASVKYGVWAVAMIFAGGYQGDVLEWKDWMLVGSHLGMAAEALLYARFFRYRIMIPAALAWTLLNDTVDYSFGVNPWLPGVLEDDINAVMLFTFALTVVSTLLARFVSRKEPVPAAVREPSLRR